MPIISTYPKLRQDWLKHELESCMHRREITVLAAAGNLATGTVMARTDASITATSAAKSGGNTGNGALTMDATNPVLGTPKRGVWTVRCIAAAANSGTFRVEDPDGNVRGDVAVGATFADGIKFAIADGATDFIVGDGFDITVADAAAPKWKKAVYGAVGPSGVAAGLLLDAVDASGGSDVKAVIVDGPCLVASLELDWDSSYDTTQKKAVALAQLALIGVQTRRLV